MSVYDIKQLHIVSGFSGNEFNAAISTPVHYLRDMDANVNRKFRTISLK